LSTSSTLDTLALLITRPSKSGPFDPSAELAELRSMELVDRNEFDRLLREPLAEVGDLPLDFLDFSTELLTDRRRVPSIELSFDRLRRGLSIALSLDRLSLKLSTELADELSFDRHRRFKLSTELFSLSIERPRRLRSGSGVDPSVAVIDVVEVVDDDLEIGSSEIEEVLSSIRAKNSIIDVIFGI